MKKISVILIIAIIGISLFGCVTTSNSAGLSSEIEYKEISANEWFDAFRRDPKDLFSSQKGYKITDVFIYEIETGIEEKDEEFLEFSNEIERRLNDWASNTCYAYATDFVKNIKETDSTWIDRLNTVRNDKKYNGHYTIYVTGKHARNVSFTGNLVFGYKTKVTVHKVEGVPSQEQIDSDKAAEAEREAREEVERKAREEAEEKARVEKYTKMNAAGKSLSKGYTYHGADEVEKNCKLFANGALESGHAYYIAGFVVKFGGSMAAIEYGDGIYYSSQTNAVYVDYISQKVKGEVVEAGVKNYFGQRIEKPITVVVAGGKGITRMPVVLGIVKEE